MAAEESDMLAFVVQIAFAGGVDAQQISLSPMADGSVPKRWAAANYKYNVTDLSGNVLGTAMTPTLPRPAGRSLIPGQGLGLGYYDATGTFQLLTAFELPA
jgi:hypothetical protein